MVKLCKNKINLLEGKLTRKDSPQKRYNSKSFHSPRIRKAFHINPQKGKRRKNKPARAGCLAVTGSPGNFQRTLLFLLILCFKHLDNWAAVQNSKADIYFRSVIVLGFFSLTLYQHLFSTNAVLLLTPLYLV